MLTLHTFLSCIVFLEGIRLKRGVLLSPACCVLVIDTGLYLNRELQLSSGLCIAMVGSLW